MEGNMLVISVRLTVNQTTKIYVQLRCGDVRRIWINFWKKNKREQACCYLATLLPPDIKRRGTALKAALESDSVSVAAAEMSQRLHQDWNRFHASWRI